MAHGIQELDNPMLGSNTPAWHDLGTVIAGQPDTETAIKVAGMDWESRLEQLCLPDGKGGYLQIPNEYACVRSDLALDDPRRVLGTGLSDRYVTISNREAFGIADYLAGEGGARFETAGTLNNGKRAWMMAVMPDSLKVKDDVLRQYLLISTKHDGTGALRIDYCDVRVVCANTWAMALDGVPQRACVRHTKNKDQQIAEAKRVLTEAKEYGKASARVFDSMAKSKIDDRFAAAFCLALFPEPATEQKWSTAAKKRERVMSLYHGDQSGGDQNAVKGTAYGLLNAFGEYVDHERTTLAMNGVSKAESRMQSVMFGGGARLKSQAAGLLTRVLEVEGVDKSKDEAVDELMSSFELHSKSDAVDALMASIDVN